MAEKLGLGLFPPTVFARIGWMEGYAGPKPGDERPIGGGSWNDTEIGHEVNNFLEVGGKFYGYFEPGLKTGELNLRRVGPLTGPDFVDGVTVVFLAPKGGSGSLVVVGWYENTRLYSDTRDHPLPVPGVKGHAYICETAASNGHLLPVQRRVWPGATGPGGFGQRNFCYSLDDYGNPHFSPWMTSILSQISRYEAPIVEGTSWSRGEIRVVIEAYFRMLDWEAAGKPYSKTEIRKALQSRLPGRTPGSIEYKLQNISAVLDESRLPWIEGYKPARNYQGLLADEIRTFLDQSPPLESPPPDAREEVIPIPDPESCVESAPSPWKSAEVQPGSSRLPQKLKVDYADKEGSNRRLGLLGERFVLELERVRLRNAGRSDLAARVEHSSETLGDGLGYDVSSYTPDGQIVRIEVKTTRLGPNAAFFMSAGEMAFANATADAYRLARVYYWGKEPSPKVFELSRDQVLALQREATHYRCWI